MTISIQNLNIRVKLKTSFHINYNRCNNKKVKLKQLIEKKVTTVV